METARRRFHGATARSECHGATALPFLVTHRRVSFVLSSLQLQAASQGDNGQPVGYVDSP